MLFSKATSLRMAEPLKYMAMQVKQRRLILITVLSVEQETENRINLLEMVMALEVVRSFWKKMYTLS